MIDLLLSTLTHDLDLSGNDLALVGDSDPVDAIAQNLRIRYQFFLGEWFLDTREGIPYYERILVKAPIASDVNSILREVAFTTPGIVEVNRFDAVIAVATRELTVALWARSDTDEPVELNQPFIIGAQS